MRQKKTPLYRKVNTRTHGVRHGQGGKSKWQRNTKTAARDTAMTGKMHSKHRHGLDYTPLFKFLLSKVGQDWDLVYREAVGRLDQDTPIFWVVADSKEAGAPFVRIGESSYYSGMFVDAQNRLCLVDPDLTLDQMVPNCPCCTHTLNGKRFTQRFPSSDDEA